MGTDTIAPEILAELGTVMDPLTAKDRCDTGACGARAYVRVGIPAGTTLAFCNHHFGTSEIQLMSAGFEIVEDIRADLLLKSSDIEEAVGA
jgi:hypothetical protein